MPSVSYQFFLSLSCNICGGCVVDYFIQHLNFTERFIVFQLSPVQVYLEVDLTKFDWIFPK